jgi:hypothetical protein
LCLAVGLSVLLRSRDAARQEGTLGLDAASSRRARRRRLGVATPG